MSLTMYRLSVPMFVRGFDVLSAYLGKAEAHAQANGVDSRTLAEARLAPDMLPLAGQIQRASDTSKNAIGRLTAIEVPRFEDSETTIAELRARIDSTVAFFDRITPADLAASESRQVALNVGQLKAGFSGADYLLSFVLPNFYFHVAMVHAILRHHGVAVGKLDYLGRYD